MLQIITFLFFVFCSADFGRCLARPGAVSARPQHRALTGPNESNSRFDTKKQ